MTVPINRPRCLRGPRREDDDRAVLLAGDLDRDVRCTVVEHNAVPERVKPARRAQQAIDLPRREGRHS